MYYRQDIDGALEGAIGKHGLPRISLDRAMATPATNCRF